MPVYFFKGRKVSPKSDRFGFSQLALADLETTDNGIISRKPNVTVCAVHLPESASTFFPSGKAVVKQIACQTDYSQEQTEEEARLLSLVHNNLIVLDNTESHFQILMPYVEGKTLSTHFREIEEKDCDQSQKKLLRLRTFFASAMMFRRLHTEQEVTHSNAQPDHCLIRQLSNDGFFVQPVGLHDACSLSQAPDAYIYTDEDTPDSESMAFSLSPQENDFFVWLYSVTTECPSIRPILKTLFLESGNIRIPDSADQFLGQLTQELIKTVGLIRFARLPEASEFFLTTPVNELIDTLIDILPEEQIPQEQIIQAYEAAIAEFKKNLEKFILTPGQNRWFTANASIDEIKKSMRCHPQFAFINQLSFSIDHWLRDLKQTACISLRLPPCTPIRIPEDNAEDRQGTRTPPPVFWASPDSSSPHHSIMTLESTLEVEETNKHETRTPPLT